MRSDRLHNLRDLLDTVNRWDTGQALTSKLPDILKLSLTTCYNHKNFFRNSGIIVEGESQKKVLKHRSKIPMEARKFFEPYYTNIHPEKLMVKVPTNPLKINPYIKKYASQELNNFLSHPSLGNLIRLVVKSRRFLKNIISNCMSVPMKLRSIVRKIRESFREGMRSDKWTKILYWIKGNSPPHKVPI